MKAAAKPKDKTRARPTKDGAAAQLVASKKPEPTTRKASRGRGLAAGPAATTPEPEAPRGRGRPTAYSPELCELVIAAGSEGLSKAQIAVKLGIARQTWHNWCDEHEEFLDAVKEAEFQALAFWEGMGQAGVLMGKQFNSAAFCFQMKNRFKADYRETVVQHNTNSESVGALMNELDGQSGRFRQAA